MMKRRLSQAFSVLLGGIAGLYALALPQMAKAQRPERKSPLADAPAVRHRAELRSRRFEIGPGVMSTVSQDFYHAVMVGGKASFHIADWLAIGGLIGHNLTPDYKTSFHKRLESALQQPMGRTPTLEEAQNGMNRIAQVFGAQLEIIPFSGKFALFQALFASYDLYAFGGPGFIKFESDGPDCENQNSCPVTGMKVGANFGVGVHAYFNDFFSLNLELRDVLLRNNPAGRDVTGDRVANSEDLSWDSNYMVGLNFTFFLPPTARVSD